MILVNDGSETEPGDVTIYLDEMAAANAYEAWFADEPHLIIGSDGATGKFRRSDNDKLRIQFSGTSRPLEEVMPFASRGCAEAERATHLQDISSFEQLDRALRAIEGERK
ncbi:hypothetical protein GGQ59_000622 [Parvularcula dongshanensis]|uniref:Uncharacterized protein n=1 Tax=Parvularcula dongshanensis TaxID=1173995 RepID=A0A840I1L1_9PROT|nr:hypothetical protein [Parvularcula dongshanensis]